MNPDETLKKIEEIDQKLDEVYKSVNQMKNYFKWTLIITVLLIVLPIIGLLFAIPSYIDTLNTITAF